MPRQIARTDGLWPVDFLKTQLTKLVEELIACEDWKNSSAKNLREPVERNVIQGNEADHAALYMRQHVSAVTLERSSQKIADIRNSLVMIAEDLRSTNNHSYGKCLDCEEPISLTRLTVSPWARRCVPCQETLEGGSPAKPRSRATRIDHFKAHSGTRRSPSKHPNNI